MDEKKECKIVQDLLPNYIEKLTSDETNKFIEEHIKQCNTCKEVFEGMNREVKLGEEKQDGREVKYIKKYNKKIKLLKAIILSVIIIIFFCIARKAFIIKSLQKKISNYTDSKNYISRIYKYEGNSLTIGTKYQKDEKYLSTMEKLGGPNTSINFVAYNDGNTTDSYIEVIDTENNKKIERLNTVNFPVVNTLYDHLATENAFEFFKNLITTRITSVECNGKECYRIVDFYSPDILYIDNKESKNQFIIYIDKKTGLPVREEGEIAEIYR